MSYERQSTAGSMAKTYLKDKIEKARYGIDRVLLKNELGKHGKDLLNDTGFYDDLSESTNLKLHGVFKNNTYL